MSYFPPCTLFLIGINLIFFVWEISTGALQDEASIIRAGALVRANVASGEIWRLFSAILLHGSFDHLISNNLMLYIVGMASEHAIGARRTIIVYTLSGLSGSLLSVTMSPGPGVGASGAIFGVTASVIVFLYKYQMHFFLRDKRIGFVLAVLALYEIGSGFTIPFIDNFAHIGGFAGGAAVTHWMGNSISRHLNSMRPPAAPGGSV